MVLEDAGIYKKLDMSGMLGLLKSFPAQCRASWRQAMEFKLPADYTGLKKVIIAGMGGSAIAADLVQSIIEPGGVPVSIYRDYAIPPILDSSSLFIASSHSGNTEETLSAFAQALKTPAKKLVLATGGKLAQESQNNKVPLFFIDARDLPPRYALGHSYLGMLGLVARACSVQPVGEDMNETIKSLEHYSLQLGEEIPSSKNPAKNLALKAHGKIVIVYGAGITAAVARRWKTQFNENSKIWSFYEVLPELNHNSIEGFCLPEELKKGLLVIMLQSSFIFPRTQLRYDITRELLAKEGIAYEILQAEGKTPLSQILNTVCLGDYTSYYLALLNGRDPCPVENVNYLKARLS